MSRIDSIHSWIDFFNRCIGEIESIQQLRINWVNRFVLPDFLLQLLQAPSIRACQPRSQANDRRKIGRIGVIIVLWYRSCHRYTVSVTQLYLCRCIYSKVVGSVYYVVLCHRPLFWIECYWPWGHGHCSLPSNNIIYLWSLPTLRWSYDAGQVLRFRTEWKPLRQPLNFEFELHINHINLFLWYKFYIQRWKQINYY